VVTRNYVQGGSNGGEGEGYDSPRGNEMGSKLNILNLKKKNIYIYFLRSKLLSKMKEN